MLETKRTLGQFFTTRNIFDHGGFREWCKRANVPNNRILEPFAGENSLIRMLEDLELCNKYSSYDINPKAKNVKFRDTLKKFPKNFKVLVTNPPYLAKNSATRRGLDFYNYPYDDLYKYALCKCLENVPYVATIIPASFLSSGLFRDRLTYYIQLPYEDMFIDTEHPVCLALFEPQVKEVKIYEKDIYIGELSNLERLLPKAKKKMKITFNHTQGNLGLRAIDGVNSPSIAFMEGKTIKADKVKHTSRNIVRIMVEGKFDLESLNDSLQELRLKTSDIFFTPFKGIRGDGKFRRRLDFSLARSFILSI